MSDTPLSYWRGFIPKRALVMAKAKRTARPASSPITPGAAALAPQAAPQSAAGTKAQGLAQIAAELKDCTRCKLCSLGRHTIVVGEGDPEARLVFVGEGPGEQEDLQGRPFIGRAGQLLDKMIEAMGLSRDRVYIANVVKCRPPGNRNPEPDEIATCSPFLYRQLATLQPKVIVALGKFSAQTILQTEERISDLRGKFREIPAGSRFGPSRVKIMPTWHPAYLLRNPNSKREAWEDLKLVAEELGIDIPPLPKKNS